MSARFLERGNGRSCTAVFCESLVAIQQALVTSFLLVSTSMTLNDLEPLKRIFC